MRTRILLLGGALFAIAIVPLDAQTLPPATPRPAQGLFDREATGNQHLEVSLLMLGAYDDNVLAAEGQIAASDTQRSGAFDGLASDMTYANKFSHGELAASARSAARYYTGSNDLVTVERAFSIGGGLRLGHMHLTASESLEYRPFFSFVNAPPLFEPALGGVISSPVAEQVASPQEARFLNSSVGLTQDFGARTSFAATAETRQGTFAVNGSRQSSQTVSARLSHKVSRDLSLVLGYSFQAGTFAQAFASAPFVHLHNVDVGVDYNHAIGRTRRTTVGFTSGTAMIRDLSGVTHRQLTGSARLNREFARTWRATASYRRSFGFVDGFQLPLFADAVAVDVAGTTARRLHLAFALGYSNGEMGLNVTATKVENYTGSARARFALSRRAAIAAEYFLYRYQFDATAVMPIGVSPELYRRGAKIGLELWLPVIR